MTDTNRYFLTEEREVTREEYIQAERRYGFTPKSGNGVATGSFSHKEMRSGVYASGRVVNKRNSE